MGMSMLWMILLQLSSLFAHGYDGVGFDGWYQPVPHRPVDIITDVINDLGVRILQQYTGHGNVAFSPTGVGFVLAALYEGSAGRGSQQIADALGLPRDRDITRIGFRDIHRRLRTYLNADGFLGGLTLNRENVRLRPEYEDILKFYGFDLSVEEESNDTTTMPETTPTPTDQPSTESTLDTDGTTSTTIEISTQDSQDDTETTTTTTSQVELLGTTLSTINIQDRLTQFTTGTILTEMLTEAIPTTISQSTTSSSDDLTPLQTLSTKTLPETSSTTMKPIVTTVSTNLATTDDTLTTEQTSQSTVLNEQTNDSMNMPNATEIPSEVTELTESTTREATVATIIEETSTILSSNLPMGQVSMNDTQDSQSSTILDSTQTNKMNDGTTSGPPADENTVSTDLSNNETDPVTSTTEIGSTDLPGTSVITGEAVSVQNEQTTTVISTTDDSMNRVRKRSVRSLRGYFSSYPDEGVWMQDLGIWKSYSSSLSEASVRDSTEISFLVNGCDISSVTATRYVAVLPFAYFPSLHAVALEFPLDDPRYNILLLMATDRRDTYRLARDLGGKSLRLLRKQLQPTWVRATIPSFMLRGFVTLTSFLQRLGIVDVFEPRAADLSPMTPELGVYARDVQQSIGVNIRNYMKPDRTHSRNGLFERAGPVPFTAVHPFLYFIIDAETSVALIAGRVNDPLNSRIL